MVFALDKVAHKVTHLESSTVAERSWVIVHSDHGPYVIGCWYRPPTPGEIDSIRSLRKSYRRMPQRPWGVLCLVIPTSIIGGG